jgi:hypothetical protein
MGHVAVDRAGRIVSEALVTAAHDNELDRR